METNLKSRIKGIALPIYFSTNRMTRRTAKRSPKPIKGYIEIYFSYKALGVDEVDLAEPGENWNKAAALYREHHVYGEHRYLVPVSRKAIEKFKPTFNLRDLRFAFEQIGNDPTTAVYEESLQLLPCSHPNLQLMLDQCQIEPFFIEIAEERFFLHVQHQEGEYCKIPSHAYSPRCWHGIAHPVITAELEHGHWPFHKLRDIPWHNVAAQPVQRNGPNATE